MVDFLLHKLPACRDWTGREYPERFGLTLICSRGFRWDGGEFETREAAVWAGELRVGRRAA